MVVGIGVPPIGMSPHFPDHHIMENLSSCQSGLVTGESFSVTTFVILVYKCQGLPAIACQEQVKSQFTLLIFTRRKLSSNGLYLFLPVFEIQFQDVEH